MQRYLLFQSGLVVCAVRLILLVMKVNVLSKLTRLEDRVTRAACFLKGRLSALFQLRIQAAVVANRSPTCIALPQSPSPHLNLEKSLSLNSTTASNIQCCYPTHAPASSALLSSGKFHDPSSFVSLSHTCPL